MSNAPRGRRSGGSAARQALRAEASTEIRTFLTRTMAPFEVLSVEGLETIEHNADTILAEMGIDFRDYPSALTLLADAGADVDGERVRRSEEHTSELQSRPNLVSRPLLEK